MRALHIPPWNIGVTPLNVHPDRYEVSLDDFWAESVELRKELWSIAGPPDMTDALTKQKADSEGMVRYYQECVDNPLYGGKGIADPDAEMKQRKQNLAREQARLK